MSELREQLREGILGILDSYDGIPAGAVRCDSNEAANVCIDLILSLTAVVEVVEALEAIENESVFNQMRYAEDTDTDYVLRCFAAVKTRARAALSRVGVLRTEVQEQGVRGSSCAERAAITACPDSPSQDEGAR